MLFQHITETVPCTYYYYTLCIQTLAELFNTSRETAIVKFAKTVQNLPTLARRVKKSESLNSAKLNTAVRY